MNIILVAATSFEIEPLTKHSNEFGFGKNTFQELITGVGMTATAYALGRELALREYDLAINAGIAGAFDRSLKLGEVVNVKLDNFLELGAEDGDKFISIDELGLGKCGIKPSYPYENTIVDTLKMVRSVTVNKVHGNDESIYSTVSRLNPDVESMEGAAFFYACNEVNLPCLQLRAISNYVERRNRESWNMPLAITNLNNILIEILTKLP
ncbi:MAG TPA: futalosine hydrolase [Pedobacter sp.]|jgi:futalosine hydrolase